MSSIQITLRKLSKQDEWRLFAPKGHPVSPVFRGDKYKALEWARAFVSSWYGWVVKLEGDNNEKKDRIPR